MTSNAEKAAARGRSSLGRLAGADEMRELYALDEFRSARQIAAEWLLITGLIYVCTRFWNPALYILCVILIGARQHALLVLMHDGAHYRLFSRRWLNDGAAELLLAWPFFISMRAYRANHLAHHRHVNSDRDPDWLRKRQDRDWDFPKSWRQIGWMLFKDLAGVNTVSLMRLARTFKAPDEAAKAFKAIRAAFYLAALGVLVYAGAFMTFVLFWLVPYFTYLALVLHLRSIAEHFGINENEATGRGVRTTRASIVERLLLSPNHINYHIEHHMFPGVPYYRLPRLHQILMSNPEFRASAHVTRGYFRVLRECVFQACTPARSRQPKRSGSEQTSPRGAYKCVAQAGRAR